MSCISLKITYMKTKIGLLSIVGIFIISLNACKKDRIEKSKNEYEPVNSYLDMKKQQEQEFVINGPSNDTIVGNQGTKLLAGKDCLMFPNGDSVHYPFSVKLVELYTPKDMMYWQMPTVAAGNILETDGEIRVRATKNNQDLVLRPNCAYGVQMPNGAPKNNMNAFYGFDTGSFFDWTDNPASLGVTTSVSPTFNIIPYGYEALIARLGWLNCGKLANNGSGNTISFTSSTDYLENVGIFIYFPTTKSVMQVYNMTSGLIPTGTSVKIVMIAVDGGGNLFHYYNTMTISANTTLEVSLSVITDPNLTNLLDGL